MKNKQNISPVGLKGNQILERQLSLMGIKPINENEKKSNSAVELTKIGPDGNAYAIVRENHEYYIKRSNKTTGLVLEDFKYIGGLQNKKEESHPTYARAIKQLNFKFKSLAEAFNRGGDINVFEDDNLLTESGIAGFSQMEGSGFSGAGNLDDNEEMYKEEVYEEETLNEFEQAIEEMMAREENLNLGDDIMNNNAEQDPFGDEDDDNYTDYTMGNHDDPNQMPNPPRELNIGEKFPDLTGDGKVTRADILKGRGVELDEFFTMDFDSDELANTKKPTYPVGTRLADTRSSKINVILSYDNNGNVYVGDESMPGRKFQWPADEIARLVDSGRAEVIDSEENDSLDAMAESIKRLDTLLEGELKKKAQTLRKK